MTTNRRFVRPFLFGCVFLFAGIASAQEFEPREAKVIAGTLNMRNVAAIDGTRVGSVSRGQEVYVLERSKAQSNIEGAYDYWYKIRHGGKTGWVFGAFLTFEVNVEGGVRWKSVHASDVFVRGVAVSQNGTILVGGEEGVIFISSNRGSSWRRVVPQALGTTIGKIHRMLVHGGSIWIAASGEKGGGVWKTTNNGGSWAQFTKAQGLPENDVFSLAATSDGSIWAGTAAGLSVSRDGGVSWNRHGPDDDLNIISLAVTDDGTEAFIGTTSGVYILREKAGLFGGSKVVWDRIGKGEPNVGNRVHGLSLTPGGTVIVGTEEGLSRTTLSNPDAWSAIGGKTTVNSVLVDSFNRILVATENGLNISLDEGVSWVTYKKEHGLAANQILEIGVDPSNRTIWATSGSAGLSRSD